MTEFDILEVSDIYGTHAWGEYMLFVMVQYAMQIGGQD